MDQQTKIPMFYPMITAEAISRATDVLCSRWVGEGDVVKEFEQALSERFGFRYPLALCNGTAALHLALVLAGVGPGDEVVTTPMTCTATNMPIIQQYAMPVFVDIQYETGNIDPSKIEAAITERTRAIMVVHWGGYPCDLAEVHDVASRYALPVIEDGAHALGATYQGCPIGNISQYTMFSFQAIKQLTTVDGGLLTVANESDHTDGRIRRWFGIDRVNRTPSDVWPGYYEWPQVALGFKYHMNNLCAAIGLGNLSAWDKIIDWRRWVVEQYRTELADVPGVTLFERKPDRVSGDWLFTMHVEDRANFHRMMAGQGIETSVCHIRNDLHPVFGHVRDDLPVLDRYVQTYISIPLHNNMTAADVAHVINAIKGGW